MRMGAFVLDFKHTYECPVLLFTIVTTFPYRLSHKKCVASQWLSENVTLLGTWHAIWCQFVCVFNWGKAFLLNFPPLAWIINLLTSFSSHIILFALFCQLSKRLWLTFSSIVWMMPTAKEIATEKLGGGRLWLICRTPPVLFLSICPHC